MSLILEDGSIVPNANSYVTVADATAYHLLYNNTDWASASSTDQENACILATQGVDLEYGDRYASFRFTDTQGLQWPRYTFYTVDGNLIKYNEIPQALKVAVYHLALEVIQGIEIVPPLDPASQALQESLKVGDLQITRQYAHVVDRSVDRKVELMLRPVLKDPRQVRMVR